VKQVKKETKLWVVTINSESGDDYGAFLFKKKPSDKQFKQWLIDNFPCDADPDEYPGKPKGPGIWGTYLYWEWNQQEVIEL
jgi:hypothetical protein